ncbi:MAG: NDP-sugar synthase [Candidatus Brennerbacteria bacterium]|nr:NDP-sugar synthase [Candidatus Brennerbacteria bacterium]
MKFPDIKVMILAAGKGTRLGAIAKNIPKAMLPIKENMPLLEHLICLMRGQGFLNFIINLHYLPEKITGYFKDGGNWAVKIVYSDETGQLLETGGAIKKAEPLLSEDFILLYGDQLHFFDFRLAFEQHCQTKALATIILKRSDSPQAGEVLEINPLTKKIIKCYPRPHQIYNYSGNLFVNSGLYILSKKILDYIPAGKSIKLDIEVMPALIEKALGVFGFIANDDILDIGTPEKYQFAKDWYEKRKNRAV